MLIFSEDKNKPKAQNKNSDDEEDEDEDDEEGGDSAAENKWGKGGINRPIMKTNKKYSLAPLHLAIEAGHLVCVLPIAKFTA